MRLIANKQQVNCQDPRRILVCFYRFSRRHAQMKSFVIVCYQFGWEILRESKRCLCHSLPSQHRLRSPIQLINIWLLFSPCQAANRSSNRDWKLDPKRDYQPMIRLRNEEKSWASNPFVKIQRLCRPTKWIETVGLDIE